MRCRVAGTLLALIFSSQVAHAEQSPPKGVQSEDATELPERNLGGHTFFNPTFFPSAFVGTRFALVQGVLLATVEDVPITSNRRHHVKLLGISERAELSLRLFDRLQPFVRAHGEAFSGINFNSVVGMGSTFAYRVGGGIKARVLRFDDPGTEVSVLASTDHGRGGVVQLLRVVEAVLQDTPNSLESLMDGHIGRISLLHTHHSQQAILALVAQRITRQLSLQGSFGAMHHSSSIRFFDPIVERELTLDDSRVDPRVGLGLQATAAPHLPVGALVEYSLESGSGTLPSQDIDERRYYHLVALGAHVVHPKFQLGITYGRTFGFDPLERTGASTSQDESGAPVIRYFQLNLEFTWW